MDLFAVSILLNLLAAAVNAGLGIASIRRIDKYQRKLIECDVETRRAIGLARQHVDALGELRRRQEVG